MSEIRVGIIGLGFMGKTHLAAYSAARASGYDVRVAGIADANIDQALAAARGNIATGGSAAVDLSSVKRFTDSLDLLADPKIDLVSICTPTDTHADLAIAALRTRKHVLVEKPVALTGNEIRRVMEAAADAPDRVCMPAMVMRFWPGWPWLRERIRAADGGGGEWGRFIGLTLQRLGSGPTWNQEFYKNAARTGGALTDLHIHDADFVVWCFGRPSKVTSVGSIDHLTTLYHFAGPLAPDHVVAQGGWNHASGFPFTMRYTAVFERATAAFDLGAGERTVSVFKDGKAIQPDLPRVSGYDAEIMHVLDAVAAARRSEPFELRATLADALSVAELLDAERSSQIKGGCQSLPG